VIKDWLEISGNFLPPEIEAKLFALNPIPSSKILQTEYPPLEELVPGLLTAGLSFLIGKPKVGKSWLGMQLAYAVMTGGKIFDKDVEKGRVLYFALEENIARASEVHGYAGLHRVKVDCAERDDAEGDGRPGKPVYDLVDGAVTAAGNSHVWFLR